MDYEVFLVRLPGYNRPTRNISKLLRVHEHGISLSTLSPTNPQAVEYSFENITNITVSQNDPSEFSFDVMDSSGSSSSHNFVCSSRDKLLTTLFNRLDDLNGIGTDFNVKKHSNRAGAFADVVLRLRSTSLVKMVAAGVRHERRKASNMKKINLQDILRIETLGDDLRLIVLHMKSRVWRLSLVKDALQFAMSVQRNIKTYLNKDIEIDRASPQSVVEARAARVATLRANPVLYEFTVMKNLEGGAGNQRERGIVITMEHLAEVAGDDLIGLHSLTDILGVVVSDKNDTEVIMEFKDWRPTQYFIQERDSFVGSVADVMGLAKGTQFSIRLEHYFSHTFPDKPLPLYQNECEIYMISRFMSVYNTYKDTGQLSSHRAQSLWYPLLKDYACNIHLGDSLIIDSRPLYAVAETLRFSLAMKPGIGATYAVTCCIVMQRLLASRACFDSVKNNPEIAALLLQAMKSPNSVVAYSAAMTLRTCVKFYANDPTATAGLSGFLGGSGPASAEAANKLVVLSHDNLQKLVAQLQTHALLHKNDLHVLGVLEILTLALNLPSADIESERQWTNSLENGLITASDVLCATSRTRSSIMFRTNSILLKTALTKCSLPVAGQLQSVSRTRCVVLLHLRHALFAKNERTRELSAGLVFLMAEGSKETRNMLNSILPTGFSFLFAKNLEAIKPPENVDVRASKAALKKTLEMEERRAAVMTAWLETLDMLRTDTLSTPVFVWNDIKRQELLKFLREEVEQYDRAAASAAGREVEYNSHFAELIYSATSDNNEFAKTIVDGIHLEILVMGPDEDEPLLASHWKLEEPVRLFQAIFHALLVCFTPLYGTSTLTEVEPRLAMDAMVWIYENHAEELQATMENLKVVETVVAMLREAIENEHHVFAFKSVFFLLLAMEQGGRRNVFRFVKAGGMPTIIPLMVVSLAKCCKDVTLFESDATSVKERGMIEKVPVVGGDGEVRMARVPSGRGSSGDGLQVQDGSMEARDAIQWQDDSVPEKLQLGLAFDLLETILRLSAPENSVEQAPPSVACQELTRHEILFHLVQMLLRAKTPFFGRILDILSSLLRANKSAVPGLYKFGIFEILLWKLLGGDLAKEDKTAIAKFLWQYHLQQDPEGFLHSPVKGLIVVDHVPWYESILRLYLPPGLLAKLIQEGSESFRLKLDEEEDSPEVIWDKGMRARLLERLAADLGPYVKARASDPQAVFIYLPRPAIIYPELVDTIFVAPLYLHNLLDVERFPQHQVADPQAFHTAVLQEYQRILSASSNSQPGNSLWRQEVPRLQMLSKAQALVLDRYPQMPLSAEAESVVIEMATPALRICIAQRDSCPVQMTSILAHAMQVLRSIAQTRDKDTEVSEAAINFALSVLSLGTRVKSDGGFPDSAAGSNLEGALAAALGVLELAAATREGRHLLKDDVRWRKGFWWALCSSAGDAAKDPDHVPSKVAFSALDCLNHFSGDVELCYRVLKQGLLLPLLLLAVPTEDALSKARARVEASMETDYRTRALEQVAAEVLRTLAVTLDQAPEADPSPRLQLERGILATVIPLAMLTSLKNPDAGAAKFLAMASADLDQPTAIWNKEVRSEMRHKVTERIRAHNMRQATGVATTSDDELKWLEEFRYESLRDEMVIAGVFVKGYATGHWEHFDLPDGRAFLDSLQDYLEANLHVLRPAEQRQAAQEEARRKIEAAVQEGSIRAPLKADLPAGEEDFLIAMAALGESLRYALEDNKKGMLAQVRYPLLAEILAKGSQIRAAQTEVAAIAQVLAQHLTAQELLLPSPLLPVMARQLWEGLTSADETALELAVAILDSLLELVQEMPADINSTNHFGSSGLLLVILALFFDVDLPPLGNSAGPPAGSGEAREAARLVAGQIIGQLLLAAIGVERRAKLVKDLAIRRSVGDLTAFANGHSSDSFSADVSDMYELSTLLEPGNLTAVDPTVVRTLFLLVPSNLLSTLARDPAEGCQVLERDICTPVMVWNAAARAQSQAVILAEAEKVRGEVDATGQPGLPAWSLDWEHGRPAYLRYVRTVVYPVEEEKKLRATLFADQEEEGYVRELCMGGFYLDQLLRNPEFQLNFLAEDRLMREIRKQVVLAAPSDGGRANEYSFDDRRRLLLALLVLFRTRPALLASSQIDIFLPIYDFFNGGSGEERTGLAQAGLLLFHCAINSSDMADFVVTEDLLATLSSLLTLHVPADEEGHAGTDPRLCSLMLLLRLARYSSKAARIALEIDLVGQLASIMLDPKGSDVVRSKASDVLSVMSEDRRAGPEVRAALQRLIPEGTEDWQVPAESIRDEPVDAGTMEHFLAHQFPSEWWRVDSPSGSLETNGDGERRSPKGASSRYAAARGSQRGGEAVQVNGDSNGDHSDGSE